MDTGWKMPNSISQDARYGKVNKYTCYSYININNILKTGTSKYANQPEYSTGTNNTHDAPRLYAYNYNFNIPSNATITNIQVRVTSCRMTYHSSGKLYTKLLKLKTGASTTDTGSGDNVASQDQSTYKTRQWKEYTYKGSPSDKEKWNLNVTPSMVNNSNFGCVYQVGNQNSSWCIPRVALIEMKIEYTEPTATLTDNNNNTVPATITITEAAKFNVSISQDSYKDNLDIFYKTTSSTLTIKYTQQRGTSGLYNSGSTPVTRVHSDDLRINNNVYDYEVPTSQVKSSSTSGSVITKTVEIYPGTLTGKQTVTITTGTTTLTATYTVKDTTNGELVDTSSIDNPSQRLFIDNCTFTENKSVQDAGALYVEGRHTTITNSKGSGNTAQNCPEIMLNSECKKFTD